VADDGDDVLGLEALDLGQDIAVAADHLRQPVAVAQVEEAERAEVADAVNPSEQHDRLADIGGAQHRRCESDAGNRASQAQ
jgi:hypothetical protein